MKKTIGIAGAGLVGRWLALFFAQKGWQVHLFDRDDYAGTKSCSWIGAGMLTPCCELEHAEPLISQLGLHSIKVIRACLDHFDEPVFMQSKGSLVVAHPGDRSELKAMQKKINTKLVDQDKMRAIGAEEISTLEPELEGRFTGGLYFPEEAQVDNRQLLAALASELHSLKVSWHTATEISTIAPGTLTANDKVHKFDWVADCRGLGAQSHFKDLRGVRGELIRLHAPSVRLHRLVRLMHPRHPIYLIPRQNNEYIIGATTIESEDMTPVSVFSAMELLSAAYTLHPGFGEARIIETAVHCRPAFSNNLPRVSLEPGLLRINGLYRHGFLVSPSLTKFVCNLVCEEKKHPLIEELISEEMQYADIS